MNKGVDNGQMGESLSRIEGRYGRAAAKTLVDHGFASHTDIATAAENGTDVYMPIKNQTKKLAAGEDPYRPLPNDSPPVADWRARMGTAEAQALHRLRASTAEWVNDGCRNGGL